MTKILTFSHFLGKYFRDVRLVIEQLLERKLLRIATRLKGCFSCYRKRSPRTLVMIQVIVILWVVRLYVEIIHEL